MAFHFYLGTRPVWLGGRTDPAFRVSCLCRWSHTAATRWLARLAYVDHKRGA